MKKSILITIFILFIALTGIMFSLIQVYATTDEIPYPFSASLIYLGTSILMLFSMLWIKENSIGFIKWFNILIVVFFSVVAFLLALICLYAMPDENVYPLASSIFVMSGIIALGSIFISKRIIKLI